MHEAFCNTLSPRGLNLAVTMVQNCSWPITESAASAYHEQRDRYTNTYPSNTKLRIIEIVVHHQRFPGSGCPSVPLPWRQLQWSIYLSLVSINTFAFFLSQQWRLVQGAPKHYTLSPRPLMRVHAASRPPAAATRPPLRSPLAGAGLAPEPPSTGPRRRQRRRQRRPRRPSS